MAERVTLAQVDYRAALWQKSRRRYMRTVIDPAVACAEAYVRDVLGITPTVRKVMPYLSWKKASRSWERGGTDNATETSLYISRDEVDHKKLGNIERELVGTNVHEMIHAARASYFPNPEVLIENIATEGLAYFGQAWSEQDIFDIPPEDTVIHDNLEPTELIEELYNDPYLWKDVMTPDDNPAFKQWLRDGDGVGFSWGHRLGIWCVKSWIEDYGKDFPTLLTMPPEEIIAV